MMLRTRLVAEPVRLDRHDAVLLGIAVRDDLHAEHACALGLVHFGHLRKTGDLALDQIIREVHEEWLGAHGRLRAQHRVPQAQGGGLADVDARGVARQHAAQLVEQVALALLLQHRLEFLVRVEVVLDRALGGAGDEHQAPGPCGERLFHRILDEGLVHHREHLLRARLGGRQEARAAAGHGKHRRADGRSGTGPHRSFSEGIDCLLARGDKFSGSAPRAPKSTGRVVQDAPATLSARSAHLNTAGRMLSHERHLGQCQYQPTLLSPQSSHW